MTITRFLFVFAAALAPAFGQPVLNAVSPNFVQAGGPQFTLVLIGSNFTTLNQVQWNGSAIPSAFVSSTQLTATVAAGLIAAPGQASVRVRANVLTNIFSAVLPVTIAGIPVLSSLAPASATAGGGSFLLIVNGTGFANGNVIQWDGTSLATTFLSSTQLRATISAAQIATPATRTVRVKLFASINVFSNSLSFQVASPPVITGLTPSSAIAPTAPLSLAVAGTGFLTLAVVRWNGTVLATTFTSSTQLGATVPTALTATPGTASVTVDNGILGGISAAASFTVYSNGVPAISALNPATAVPQFSILNLIINGSGFNPGTTAELDGSPLATTFVSATQITAAIPGTATYIAGNYNVTALNPAPGGGVSPPSTFAIINPVPSITAVNPTSLPVNAPNPVITVTGSGFHFFSRVRYGGNNLVTNFVDSTHLNATIASGSLQLPNASTLQVANNAGTTILSNTVPFAIEAPVPAITSVTPGSVFAGSPTTTITVTGTGFLVYGSFIRINGVSRITTVVNPTTLSASLFPNEMYYAGSAVVDVSNLGPGGGLSNQLPFQILAPHLSSVSPPSLPVAIPSPVPPLVTITVDGAGFVPASVIWAGGALLTTTFVSSTQLTAVMGSNVLQRYRPGGIPIVVENAFQPSNALAIAVGGGASPGTPGNNVGTIVLHPLPPVPLAPFSIEMEGCQPGMPFTLVVDVSAAPPIINFPDPGTNMVLSILGGAISVPLLDGLGAFGPVLPVVFGGDPSGTPPFGVFSLTGLVAPSPPTGLDLTLQTAYVDPTSPIGLRLTWALWPVGI